MTRGAVDLAHAFGLEPVDAVKYFQDKGYAITWNWRDQWQEAHAKAFTVAGVTKVDVLQDIRAELDKAIKGGSTFADFRANLQPLLERKGWWGKSAQIDRETGEVTGKGLTPRRLQTIFQTNVQTSYMAGRYRTMMANVDHRPFWKYVAILDGRTRPAHRLLHGRVFRFDDPFWDAFYPPNGFNCRCRVDALDAGDMADGDLVESSSDDRLTAVELPRSRRDQTPVEVTGYRDPVSGKTIAPDPGWSYNVGKSWVQPFTPERLDALPTTFPATVPNAELPPLPRAATVEGAKLLPAGEPPQQYAQAFLRMFGADLDKSVVYKDVAGDELQINADLFKTGAGQWKADNFGRGRYMELLAQAVIDPSEIWQDWDVRGGATRLVRRYVRELETAEGDWGLAVFEYGNAGWTGVTIFPPKTGKSAEAKAAYIDAQRGRFLRYKRP